MVRGMALKKQANDWINEYVHIPEFFSDREKDWMIYTVRQAYVGGYYAKEIEGEDAFKEQRTRMEREIKKLRWQIADLQSDLDNDSFDKDTAKFVLDCVGDALAATANKMEE